MTGRETLERWKAEHSNLDRYGDEMTYCVRCERGPWPCKPARLIAALEEALATRHSPRCQYDPCICGWGETILAKLTAGEV